MYDLRRGRCFLAALLLSLGLAACNEYAESPVGPQAATTGEVAVDPQPAWADAPPDALRVYTQNVYLGGDTGVLLALDLTDGPAVLAAVDAFWTDVRASDVPGRIDEIVDEIAARRPHVVSLQEMLRFVVLDAAFQPVGGIDFLAEIEAEIADRRLPYVTEVSQESTSSTLPLAVDANGAFSRFLNFTDREVSLRRTDVELVDEASGVYEAEYEITDDIVLRRAWTRTSVRRFNTTYHVLNTHLEVQPLGPIQAEQARELREEIIAGLEGVTVISGDLNSNAAAPAGDATWTPTYQSLITAGFVDAWASTPSPYRGTGLTCCHPNSLSGVQPFTQRIDFVLVRSSELERSVLQRALGLFRTDIVGEEASDLTMSGLWPSDHAGLVADLRVPQK